MAALDVILTILDFLFSLIIIFFTVVIFHPMNKLKRFKVKEEQLFLQKTLITTFFFIFFLLFIILSIAGDDLRKYSYIAHNFFLNVYIILLLLYNLMMAIETYRTYINPVHFFNRLFRQNKFNYIPELIIFISVLITIGLDFAISYKNLEVEGDDKDSGLIISYLFLLIEWKPFVIMIISIVCIVLYCKIQSVINQFYFNNQKKLIDALKRRSLNYYLYLVLGVFYLFPIFEKVTKRDSTNSEFLKFFGTIIFYIVIFDDYIISLTDIASTKFCEYRLKNTYLGHFCACLVKSKKKRTGIMTPLMTESTYNERTDISGINDVSNTLDLVSHNINDKELISVFKNGLFIEDYFLSYFDQILNIITASLYQVYNSKYFSTQANEQNISSKLKIQDISAIGGNMKDMSVSAIGTKAQLNTSNEVGDETVHFNINKNLQTDDLKRFQNILENSLLVKNNNNYLNISINSFFTPRCVESIYSQKIKGRNIGASLLSHMILNNLAKNRNPENPRANFWSLLASNGKEQYFRKMKNTSIKTFDKNFTLDLFDTDDGDLTFFKKGDNNFLAQLLDQYFTYIHSKGINGTFIPILVGVFKIKINKFKSLLVFITRNSLVENAPKDHFSYWQLLRILKGKPQKVASSQFNSGLSFVKDDPIFERAFQIESIKENPNYNKILFKNYNDFQTIINNDVEFLRQLRAKNFDLLLMYYQFENTQKHEKEGALKIRQTNRGTEFVEEEMPKGLIEEDVGTPQSKEKKNSFDGDFLSGGKGGFFDDEIIGGGDFNMKKVMNDLDSNDKSNMNGYEGLFDNFNCLCFFTFENVFDIRNRESINDGYYDNFKNNILENFTECKK